MMTLEEAEKMTFGENVKDVLDQEALQRIYKEIPLVKKLVEENLEEKAAEMITAAILLTGIAMSGGIGFQYKNHGAESTVSAMVEGVEMIKRETGKVMTQLLGPEAGKEIAKASLKLIIDRLEKTPQAPKSPAPSNNLLN